MDPLLTLFVLGDSIDYMHLITPLNPSSHPIHPPFVDGPLRLLTTGLNQLIKKLRHLYI